MRNVVDERKREREAMIGRAAEYVDRLEARAPVEAAAVAGSVARGDFNVWSDVDVVVVVTSLPYRAPERSAWLLEGAPAGVQPIGFTPDELRQALRRRNALALEAVEAGVLLRGTFAPYRR